ncbi:hypothetical protein Scep_010212 [Stephania cephalantha]|uniref:Uncharacterized protein n=1 Tax=Stephania cephalantha TaxID=152367 RepID=A0AAP0PH06_9MAGN
MTPNLDGQVIQVRLMGFGEMRKLAPLHSPVSIFVELVFQCPDLALELLSRDINVEKIFYGVEKSVDVRVRVKLVFLQIDHSLQEDQLIFVAPESLNLERIVFIANTIMVVLEFEFLFRVRVDVVRLRCYAFGTGGSIGCCGIRALTFFFIVIAIAIFFFFIVIAIAFFFFIIIIAIAFFIASTFFTVVFFFYFIAAFFYSGFTFLSEFFFFVGRRAIRRGFGHFGLFVALLVEKEILGFFFFSKRRG